MIDSAVAIIPWSKEEISGNFKESAAKSEAIFSSRPFSEESFAHFLNEFKRLKIPALILDKRSLTQEQQKKILEVVNSNEKKGTKLLDIDRKPFGSVYTDYHAYNVEKANAQLEMHETTNEALKHLSYTGNPVIIDFGAGTGQDSVPLIKRGYSVTAIDGDEEALNILISKLSDTERNRVSCYKLPFIEYTSEEKADLFISSFTWPYRPPYDFPACWDKTVSLVKIGGMIAGHFFGPIDEPDTAMTYHTEDQLRALLNGNFEILFLKVETKGSERKIFGGEAPAWGDLFHVVARKIC